MGFLAAGAIFGLANCSSGGGGSSSPSVNQYGQCTASGQVYITQANGCVAQGSCQVGYGFYNNQCLPGTTGGGYGNSSCGVGSTYSAQYGCLAQGNCPVGFGSINGTCIQGTSANMPYQGYGQQGGFIGGGLNGGFAQQGLAGQCGIGAVMTSRGCLPQYAGCYAGGGYAFGRCWY